MRAVYPTVRINGIAAGGAGVGRLSDGRVVFVHRTAPEDRVEIELIEEKKRFARGRLLRVLEAGADRRSAPCPHYARCGGCTLEHLEYHAQLAAKSRIVRDALQRIAGIPIEQPEIVASPREFRYRNRVSFSLVRTPRGRVIAGFHEIDRPDRLVDISANCLLPEEAVANVWGELRANWGADANLLPSGDQLRLTLRGSSVAGVGLLIEGGYSQGQPSALLQAVPSITAVWHRPEGASQYALLAGTDVIADAWSSEDVEVSGSVFLQVNRAAAELLEHHVLARARTQPGERVVDAYCGIGLHARRLARLGCSVVGIELDPVAVAEARRAAPENTRFITARVEDVIGDHLPADLVIVNPPRAGLSSAVADALTGRPAARIIYVSCDPATLARDLRRLSAKYLLASVRCFDLFPQTSHVETVADLQCAIS